MYDDETIIAICHNCEESFDSSNDEGLLENEIISHYDLNTNLTELFKPDLCNKCVLTMCLRQLFNHRDELRDDDILDLVDIMEKVANLMFYCDGGELFIRITRE